MKRLINSSNVTKNIYDLEPEQFKFYSNDLFDKSQREEIAWGFKHGLTVDNAEKYLLPSMDSYEMYEVLEIMLNQNISKKLFELYKKDPKLAKVILHGIGAKSGNRYMTNDNFDQIMKMINTNKFNDEQIEGIAWLICFDNYNNEQINKIINDNDFLNKISNYNKSEIIDEIRNFFKNRENITSYFKRHFVR